MELNHIQTIVVIGAGVMGRGIALVCARSGFQTVLFDVKPEMLTQAQAYVEKFFHRSVEKKKLLPEERDAALGRLAYTTVAEDLIGDLIIEAVPESLDLKHRVLSPIQAQNSPETIMASNTSTLPITRIAAGLPHPDRVVGLHFFNPAPLMKLVEVIAGADTDPAVQATMVALARKLDKTPVQAADTPGFIVNRVARQFYLESLRIVEEGAATFPVVDRLMRSSGFRMGPFELMDLIGVETNHAVTQSMYAAFFQDEKFRPSLLQQQKVDAGHFGRKTRRGFYRYPEEEERPKQK
ncbi:MAG: 3-hydroxybutyryl-CoA dehydrogenase [Bacteroidetes bacterium]|nr:MAG: 3-hydroxybutyryl-CoA dehydrogenase [Bacteroidota bacterium]